MTINNYIKYIVPYLKNFIKCDIYSFELRKIEQKMAESLNQKDIYSALDLPDFRYVKDKKLELFIVEFVIQKIKLGNIISIFSDKLGLKVELENELYQVIIFQSGSLPEINITEKKVLFFMYQPDFKTVFYCGKYVFDKLSESVTNKFYQEHCLKNSNVFFDFNILKYD